MANDYGMVHAMRKPGVPRIAAPASEYHTPKAYQGTREDHPDFALPPSQGESVKPDFLLHHQNNFDSNAFEDRDIARKNANPVTPVTKI